MVNQTLPLVRHLAGASPPLLAAFTNGGLRATLERLCHAGM
jgi:hypothetical protein